MGSSSAASLAYGLATVRLNSAMLPLLLLLSASPATALTVRVPLFDLVGNYDQVPNREVVGTLDPLLGLTVESYTVRIEISGFADVDPDPAIEIPRTLDLDFTSSFDDPFSTAFREKQGFSLDLLVASGADVNLGAATFQVTLSVNPFVTGFDPFQRPLPPSGPAPTISDATLVMSFVVPEPSTAALLVAGLVMAASPAIRRKQLSWYAASCSISSPIY